MNLSGNLYTIPWTCFVLGARNLVVETPEGEIYVRYHGESKHGFEFTIVKHRNTDEVFEVPTLSIVRLPTQIELFKCDADFKAKKDAEAAEEEMMQMKRQGIRTVYPKPQRHYTYFEHSTLIALFLLCRRYGIDIGFNYKFNLVVSRLSHLGDQSRFPIPQLSEEERIAFYGFQQKYQKILGKVMGSPMKRRRVKGSKIVDMHRWIFEYHCLLHDILSPDQEDIDSFLKLRDAYFEVLAEKMSTTSESALSDVFPESYWTGGEIDVVLEEVEEVDAKVPHCFLLENK